MKPDRSIGNYCLRLSKALIILLLLTNIPTLIAQNNQRVANVLIQDTVLPFVNELDLQDRTSWKVIPSNVLMLEDNPSAAISDPSFSGREYTFKGDIVVETEKLTAVFLSKKGKAVIYWKAATGKKQIEVIPLQLKGKQSSITNCRILQNSGDDVVLEVSFSTREMPEPLSVIFSFGRDEIVDINPAENVKGIIVKNPIKYFVVPDFLSDDLIFDPGQYPSARTLDITPGNLFLGLLQGENSMMVVTLPSGKQQTRLVLDKDEGRERFIESVEFNSYGKSFYLAILEAPGIWHKEQLKASYLEKDVSSDWKKPFSAKWITQLNEVGVKTTFTFREFKNTIWRGVIGSYTYPVWFDGDNTFYRLGKKIPPRGDSLIYFLERKNTPISVSTPVDILKQTLGRQTSDRILDLEGRMLRTHHRRAGEGVRRACTCGCTAAIEEIFKLGQEVEKKAYVSGAVDDMVYFVDRHVERINEYRVFAKDMIEFLKREGKSKPRIKPFLDSLEQIVREIPQEYTRQTDNMKTMEYTDQLASQTKALTQKKYPGNLPACLELGKKWRDMGGAQDYVVAKFHSITRHLCQEAGYGCVNQPDAVETAQEIRKRCRNCLRNPDSYEIWSGY